MTVFEALEKVKKECKNTNCSECKYYGNNERCIFYFRSPCDWIIPMQDNVERPQQTANKKEITPITAAANVITERILLIATSAADQSNTYTEECIKAKTIEIYTNALEALKRIELYKDVTDE